VGGGGGGGGGGGRQLSWRIGESIKDEPAYWMEVRRIWWD
jgi:hypothetical protein